MWNRSRVAGVTNYAKIPLITARRPADMVGWWLNSDHVVSCPEWNILRVRRARGGGCWYPGRRGVLPVPGLGHHFSWWTWYMIICQVDAAV